MRLVFLTQVVDSDHPALAQTVDVVGALAGRCERVAVLCDRVGRHDLPANVALHTFAAATQVGRGLRFERALAPELLGHRPEAVLAHMVPRFLALAAPLAKARRVPLLLWYTHWHASRELRLATRLADLVLSVDRRSFPVETDKARGIGHAVDVDVFTPGPRAPHEGPLRLLALGRIARWKGYDTMLEALRIGVQRGLDATLHVHGPALTADEHAHRAELETAAATPDLAGRVSLFGPVPRERVPELLRSADALVSATQPAESLTLDKVVYEAAACGVPVVASNPGLDEFLGGLPVELRFPPRDAQALAGTLLALAAADRETLDAAGAELRRRVERDHSLVHWAEAVLAAVRETGGRRRRE